MTRSAAHGKRWRSLGPGTDRAWVGSAQRHPVGAGALMIFSTIKRPPDRAGKKPRFICVAAV
jgi:hypothetical protein